MEELKKKIAEILEVSNLDASKKFTDYDEWDSLAGLSILAMLDSDYGIHMTIQDIYNFANIDDFCKSVLSK